MHLFNHPFALFRIFDDAAFADLALADFELWFDQRDDASTVIERWDDGRQDIGGRNEGDIDRDEIKFAVEIRLLKISRVDAFTQIDARIVAQPPVYLIMTDIDGADFARLVL